MCIMSQQTPALGLPRCNDNFPVLCVCKDFKIQTGFTEIAWSDHLEGTTFKIEAPDFDNNNIILFGT